MKCGRISATMALDGAQQDKLAHAFTCDRTLYIHDRCTCMLPLRVHCGVVVIDSGHCTAPAHDTSACTLPYICHFEDIYILFGFVSCHALHDHAIADGAHKTHPSLQPPATASHSMSSSSPLLTVDYA